MALNKYFIDNVTYGVDAMNKIVSGLRTTGVDGEVTDGLLVTKNSGLAVNIAPGRGWVDGCQIEVTETETRTAGSTAGPYSVIMQLEKPGTQVDDIDLAVVEGAETGPHVLAQLTVSGGAVTGVTDMRTWSRAVGNTTVPVSMQSGSATLSGTVAAGKTITKTVVMPSGAVKVLGFMRGLNVTGGEYGSDLNSVLQFSVGQGLEYLFGSRTRISNAVARFPLYVVTGTLTTKDDGGELFSFGLFATGNKYVRVASMSLTGGSLAIVFENVGSGSRSFTCEILWEAWNYDTV